MMDWAIVNGGCLHADLLSRQRKAVHLQTQSLTFRSLQRKTKPEPSVRNATQPQKGLCQGQMSDPEPTADRLLPPGQQDLQQDVQPSLLQLPSEVLLGVLSMLHTEGLHSVAETCKELRHLVLLTVERLTLRIEGAAYKEGRIPATQQLLSAVQRSSGNFTLRLRVKGRHSSSTSVAQQQKNLAAALHLLGRCPAVVKLELRNAIVSILPSRQHAPNATCIIVQYNSTALAEPQVHFAKQLSTCAPDPHSTSRNMATWPGLWKHPRH
jgi:hypothetical protein